VTDIVVADPRGDSDLERFAEVDSESFTTTREYMLKWLTAGRGQMIVRLARDGDDVLGGYGLLPCGQWFGGNAVPARAVVAVSVRPSSRRRGVAGALMRDLVDVARSGGAALAPLYAATTRFYRRWGWGVGDRSYVQEVKTPALAHFSGNGRALRDPSHAQVEALRRGYLRHWDGPLDRPDWWLDLEWDAGEPSEHRFLYGWMEGDALTGVTRYQQTRRGPWMDVGVHELIATTKDALHGLLGFLGGHEAQCEEIKFKHSTLQLGSELAHLIPDADRVIEVRGFIYWMQRIVDIEAAVRARGWARHVDGSLELEVTDPARDEPERFVLEVSGGRGAAAPGGAGRVQCGIGALGAWYSGTLRARDASRLELMRGSGDDIALLDAMIGDRNPWMPDYF
jgi:predicted acetyltransferase